MSKEKINIQNLKEVLGTEDVSQKEIDARNKEIIDNQKKDNPTQKNK